MAFSTSYPTVVRAKSELPSSTGHHTLPDARAHDCSD